MINTDEKSMQLELEVKLEEAMTYLQIPDFGAVITREGIRQEVNHFPSDASRGHYCKRLHQIRAGLYAVIIMDSLGINDPELRHTIFGAFVGHDRGQRHLSHLLDRDNLSDAEMEEMKRHVDPEYLGTLFNETATAIAERHHKHHGVNRHYPDNPKTKPTPEVGFISYAICAQDTYDSASTRVNGSTHFCWTDKESRAKLHSQKDIRDLLISDQGNNLWCYEGKFMPSRTITGKYFIRKMYEMGFFGQEKIEDRMNPFRDIKFGKTPRI